MVAIMPHSLELEGTWEEILTHASEFTGRRVRLIVLSDETSTTSLNTALTSTDRQAFLRLSLEERRRILAERAEAMKEHYEQDPEWKEFLAGDIVEY